MFAYLHADSSVKQPVTFIASLCLQSAVLVILCGIPFPQISGPSIRPNAMPSFPVTPIYLPNETIATTPSVPQPAPSAASQLAPKLPSEAKLDTKQEINTQAGSADDSSGKAEEQGLAPFAGWQMNSMASGSAGMYHQVKNALPVFTPDPPILHGEVPELARGKDVVLDVVIDAQGSIAQVEIRQGIGGGIENSIVETLRRWIFVPAKFNGVAIASRRQLRFHFPG
jgi:TonB family protein